MTEEEIRKSTESSETFATAISLLSGAQDLLFYFIEYANITSEKEIAENLYKVYNILDQSINSFNEYEKIVYG